MVLVLNIISQKEICSEYFSTPLSKYIKLKKYSEAVQENPQISYKGLQF